MIRQSGSLQLLDTCATSRIVRTLKRIHKKLKSVCTENNRYQLENFRGSFCNKCQTNIKNRFKTQILYEKIIEPSLSIHQKIKQEQFTN